MLLYFTFENFYSTINQNLHFQSYILILNLFNEFNYLNIFVPVNYFTFGKFHF